jgi:hypothetical protein
MQVLAADRQKACRTLLKDYYQSLTKHVLLDYKELRKLEKQNRRILQVRQLNATVRLLKSSFAIVESLAAPILECIAVLCRQRANSALRGRRAWKQRNRPLLSFSRMPPRLL